MFKLFCGNESLKIILPGPYFCLCWFGSLSALISNYANLLQVSFLLSPSHSDVPLSKLEAGFQDAL